jgi:hypothetical protein
LLSHPVHFIKQAGELARTAARHTTAAGRPYGVDLVDIGAAGPILAGQLARLIDKSDHPQDICSPEHRPEAGALDRDKSHTSFSGHHLCQQGFPGSGRTIEQQPVDKAAALLIYHPRSSFPAGKVGMFCDSPQFL